MAPRAERSNQPEADASDALDGEGGGNASNVFSTRRRVEFSDTDMAGIIHFSRYFIYMESAEHLFWNHLGTSVHTEIEGMKLGWPRVAASCDFIRPVRFEDEIDITVSLGRMGEKSLVFDFHFEHAGRTVARGQTTTVCCRLTEKGPRGVPIPAELRGRIEPYLRLGEAEA